MPQQPSISPSSGQSEEWQKAEAIAAILAPQPTQPKEFVTLAWILLAWFGGAVEMFTIDSGERYKKFMFFRRTRTRQIRLQTMLQGIVVILIEQEIKSPTDWMKAYEGELIRRKAKAAHKGVWAIPAVKSHKIPQ